MQLHLTSFLSVRHLKVIYKKIATELRTRINSDDYAVGDMLPSEKALAAELKVSVMTLRKALALLEEEKLIARRHGSIIAFSSGLAHQGWPLASAYAATKGALIAFVKSAAKEVAKHRVKVNLIAPGVIDTPLSSSPS